MKTVYAITAAVLALSAGAAAHAATLTFDGLNTTYGDGYPVGPAMFTNQTVLSYAESGYVLTLNTSNPEGSFLGAHIGDGTGTADTFNWHDGSDNGPGAYVTLTKIGGGSFNLLNFDYFSNGGLSIASGAYDLNFAAYDGGTATANFMNVTSVTFYGAGDNQLDNLAVSDGAVPEPASWAMMLGGFGLVGGALRSRRRSVRFA